MGNFFSSFFSFGCDGATISGWGLAAVMFLGPYGQLYQRITALGGSLDKWYFLLIPIFWVFPFSLAPALTMYFGCVNPAKCEAGPCPEVYDWWMIGPMIMKLCSGFIVSTLFPEGGYLSFFLPFMLQLAVTMVPLYIKNIQACNRLESIKDIFSVFDFGKLSFAFTNAVIQNGVADVIVSGISYMPIIGQVIMVIQMIPVVGDIFNQILWSICYGACYIIMNMINNNWRSDWCEIRFFGQFTDVIAAIILFGFSVMLGLADSAMSIGSSFGSSSITDYF